MGDGEPSNVEAAFVRGEIVDILDEAVGHERIDDICYVCESRP
jgi:hypothetical protein